MAGPQSSALLGVDGGRAEHTAPAETVKPEPQRARDQLGKTFFFFFLVD